MTTTYGDVVGQRSFDELGSPLRETTFCVVDLETTGGSPTAGSAITEIGAVKIRGGEVLGEFQTLVNPGAPIPPFVAVLTGITDGLVATAPPISAVLPSFLEFAHGCVLVAHNAPFDVGFLRHFAGRTDRPWPGFQVVDTARLARRALTRDDAPDCRLTTLARVLHAEHTPTHRALDDARATVDVLHSLLERLGPLGVQTLEELRAFTSQVTPAQRRKRHLAEPLPHAPGVYLFRDARGTVLYVGTSKDLRTRVRTYFTAAETRSRMGEMVGLAESVEAVECATILEAAVRELRLLARHKPPYNRRSRHPERVTWVKVTIEPWPRLSLVRAVLDDTADYVGPFSSRRTAEQVVAALHETFPIRQCGGRLPRVPRGSPCILAEMGRCLAPCDGRVDPAVYAAQVQALRRSLVTSPGDVVSAVTSRMQRLAAGERFEDAATHRDRLAAFVRSVARAQRLAPLVRCAELVAARRAGNGDWELHVVRYGRLAGAGRLTRGTDARRFVDDLRASAETVPRPTPGRPAAGVEESEQVARWLGRAGTRLVHVEGTWTCPVGGAESLLRWLDSPGARLPTPRGGDVP